MQSATYLDLMEISLEAVTSISINKEVLVLGLLVFKCVPIVGKKEDNACVHFLMLLVV